ncbi:MAG: hypothetical protein ACXVB0_20025 [Mucilaginibacter sp.]
MINQFKLLFLILCFISFNIARASVNNIDTPQVKNFPLQFDLPNNHWHLTASTPSVQYLFKRDPVTNAVGRQIIPAIMILAEDASNFKQDVALFCSKKMQPFQDRGVKVPQLLIWQDKDYPVAIRNSILARGEYVDKDVAHIIYMIYIIDRHDKGIQVYLDMTKDIAAQYEPEFLKTIRSLQLVP